MISQTKDGTEADRRLILLGPQPEYRSLRMAIDRLGISGPVAVMTAGWEEDELDSRKSPALMAALPGGSFNLQLFARSEELFQADPALIQALRDRQDELRLLRDLYKDRLELMAEAARITWRRRDERVDFLPERESCIEAMQLLDRQHFLRTSQVCDIWEDRMKTPARNHVVRHRQEVAEQLAGVQALLISGGHAAIILNRLMIFDVLGAAPNLPVIGWSGGAMALAEQIVFFHDSPPQGRGDAEVLRAGMAMFERYLPLPDARNRLILDDRERVALFSRRFDRYQCVVMDENTIMDRQNGEWWISPGTVRLDDDGSLAEATG